jgi:hypothetical protein
MEESMSAVSPTVTEVPVVSVATQWGSPGATNLLYTVQLAIERTS